MTRAALLFCFFLRGIGLSLAADGSEWKSIVPDLVVPPVQRGVMPNVRRYRTGMG